MWNILFPVKFIAFMLFFFVSTQAWAAPFTCTGNIYQVQSGQFRIFDPITSTYTDIGPDGRDYNAIGYNQNDNMIYGIRGQMLIRIDATGQITEIFDTGLGSFTGDMDLQNQLWIRNANNFHKINVITQNIDTISLTGSDFPGGSADIAFVATPLGDRIVQVGRTRMAVFNPVTETSTTAIVADLPNEGSTGAIWADSTGRVFLFKNTTGNVYELFDYLTPNPRAVLVARGVPSNSNDGTSCRAAPFPNFAPLAFDDEFETEANTPLSGNILYDNGNGADNDPEGSTLTVETNPIQQPANGTVIINPDGSFTYTPNPGFFGVDSFVYQIADSSGIMATATVTITEIRAELEVEKKSTVFTPTSFTSFALPGNDVIYTITVRNVGTGPTDADTIFLVDRMPDNIQFFNDDIDSGGSDTFTGGNPIGFIDEGSGTDFNFSRDVKFSNASTPPTSLSDCNYTPVNGYDPEVHFICINPKGQMLSDDNVPSFSFSFRARID